MRDLNERAPTRIQGHVQAEHNVVELRREREIAQERQSFEELFLDQHDRLYRALYFITGSRDDAEELMQDAFLKLWERWDAIDRIDDPIGYLFRTALNGFRTRRRRAAMALSKVTPIPEARDAFLKGSTRLTRDPNLHLKFEIRNLKLDESNLRFRDFGI